MKKKYILSLLIGCVLTGSFSTCTNLDEDVYDTIPASEFGKTPAQINSIIAPIYKTLKEIWPGDFFCLMAETSDIGISPTRRGGDWWDGGAHMEMKLHTWTARSTLVTNSWNACTNGISTCNQIYNIIEKSEMEAELKTRTLCEIRGIRAFWYYMLIDNFGNAPLAIDFNNTELPTVTPRQELYKFVVDELNAIKDILREDVTSSSYGKFTKGAAYTLLAKMYLNAEVWAGSPNWEGVIEACDVVMNLPYIIEPDWKASFIVNNQNSKEIILPVCFGKSDGGNHMHKRSLHYLDPIALGMTVGTWNGISAQPNYVKKFDDADKRKTGSFLIGPMIDPATGEVLITGHNRPLIHTIDLTMIEGSIKEGEWGEVNQEDGARVNKWEFEVGLANSDQENDFAIFRLADVYLMKAEALLRLGRDNEEATRLINIIRERGFGNTDHNYTSTTLENIYLERCLELAWENMNRQDMIRFGKFLEPGYLKPNRTPDYRLLFPIPQTAFDTNNKLVQNPGYPQF
ncbi:RagB/SusD family nutrient uptake outer membrane protein [Parabacteroides sp. Marseille-P3160]|uniref:RagB/SusD family nutrient uptake outer membrane protein n=1 Tax=Parabacteroides sp. Marseille-P3160 TaxID=1917887 RepID=UPI0009BC720E|nr:RagB/SusD family nutrient uptake outer membrane protein [Parabacteroides sp. Marseille-P3160]